MTTFWQNHESLSYLLLQVIAVLVQNMLPLQVIDSKSIIEFVEACVPGKHCMSRRTLTRRIEEKYRI